MALAAPFLIAGFEPIPSTPVPPATGAALEGLVVAPNQGWDTTSAARLSEGDSIAGVNTTDVNVRIQVCCPRTQTSLPVVGGLQCTQVSASTACDGDETRHTVTAWEDGPSISTDGATLFYNYSIVDFAQVVTCFNQCLQGCLAGGGTQTECAEERCPIHCGDPIYGPIRDNNGGGNRVYGSTLVEISTNPSVYEWRNIDPLIMDPLEDDQGSDRAPSVAYDGTWGDFLAYSHSTTTSDPDLYLSEYDGVNDEWGAPATIDSDAANAPWINTACEEENPHLVRDADGLRLYFESNRMWYFDGDPDPEVIDPDPFRAGNDLIPAAQQPCKPWNGTSTDEHCDLCERGTTGCDSNGCPVGDPQCLKGCTESMRNLFVTFLEDGQTDWTEPVRVNVPDAALTGAPWADIRKAAPFVTPGDPAEPSGAPRGRQIYWLGRANDCHLETSTPTDETKAALGCIYRAEQSGDQAIDAAWTNVTKILTPTPILEGALGDVVVVTNPSLSGDRNYLYFTYIERGKAPDDVEPPVNLADSLDDTDPQNPPTDVNVPMTDPVGLLIGDVPLWQNWRFSKGLADPANYDAGSGDTTGWEDSVNISADGRTLYFGYSPWILGHGLHAAPDYCKDPLGEPPSPACNVGRRVAPRILANGPTRDSTAGNPSSNGPKGVSIYEATIDTTANPTEWDIVFSEVNYEHYCLPPGTNAGQCQGTPYSPSNECPYECLSEHTVCLNDILGETSLAPDDGVCFTSKDQGYNEGAVTVSTAANGKDHMVFVRYGDIAELVPSAPLTSPPETVSWRMYTSTRDCDSNGNPTTPIPGQGTHWCTPSVATFTIQDGVYDPEDPERYCDDNDPHLTAYATSVYFDSRRGLIGQTPDVADRCRFKDLGDMRVYHASKTCGTGSDEWCTTAYEVIGGPNLKYVPWSHDDCDQCAGNGTALNICPAYCAPTSASFWTGVRAYNGHQAFVPEDESGMWFLGDGRDCNPDVTKYSQDIDLSQIVTSCIYYAARADPPNQVPPGTSDPARPAFNPPFLVARAQAHDARPCQPLASGETVDPDIGKITGLGEPSVTKDGKFFYFAYIRKLATGEPLDSESLDLCDPGDPEAEPDPIPADDSSDPAKPLCMCDDGPPAFRPKGCWLPACTGAGGETPGIDCKQACDAQHIDGSNTNECLPPSVLYCANPTQSQSLTDSSSDGYGVDVFEFNIGVARRESWDPSVGVVSAASQ